MTTKMCISVAALTAQLMVALSMPIMPPTDTALPILPGGPSAAPQVADGATTQHVAHHASSLVPMGSLPIVHAEAPAAASSVIEPTNISPQNNNNNFCKNMGTTASKYPSYPNLPLCLELHPLNIGFGRINVPVDTETSKYGIVRVRDFLYGAYFIDRNGVNYALADPQSLFPADLYSAMTFESRTDGRDDLKLVFEATFSSSTPTTIVSLKPILYVPYSTVLADFRNTTFAGNAINHAPLPQSIPESTPFTATFGSQIQVNGEDKTQTLVSGTLHTLFQNTLSGSTCQPALCDRNAATLASSEACNFYTSITSQSDQISLHWDPEMHGPIDTELVLQFSNGINFMSRFVQLYDLFNSIDVVKPYDFLTHANILGTLEFFKGTFSKTVSPVTYC